MPYNGAGIFTSLGVPTFPAVTGDYILASYFNATMSDIFLGLSTALPRDGQAGMSANLPLAGFKVTGLGAGTAPNDAVNFAQVFTAPTFTNAIFAGIPVAPTPAPGTNTTQVATMAALQAAIASLPVGALPVLTPQTKGLSLSNDGISAIFWAPSGDPYFSAQNFGGF